MIDFLMFTNETLTAAIVIVAASMLLYQLVRNRRDRVTRASAAVLGCVTMAYFADTIAGLDNNSPNLEAWHRVQWIGIAFVPAAMFHLADALLSTTGQVSRGRRRRVVRLLYLFSAALTLLAAFTTTILTELETDPIPHMKPGPLFFLYTAYFLTACAASMWLVWRARKRCLTSSTRQRMTLLFAVILTPGLGIFPYYLLFASVGDGGKLPLLLLVIGFNLANIFMVIMLLFLVYPLSFFGTNKPDRLVKADLLEFLLRGPFTAIVLLAALVTAPRFAEVLVFKKEDLVIVSAVGILLFMQWSITFLLPLLEKWLIYTADQREARQLRQLSEHLLTRADSYQLQEAILAAVCDQMGVPTAFIATIQPDGARLEQVVGEIPDKSLVLNQELPTMEKFLPNHLQQYDELYVWKSFWLVPLRETGEARQAPLLGIMGIWAREIPPQLSMEEQELLAILAERAARLLADRRLQAQLFHQLDEFAAGFDQISLLGDVTRFGQIQQATLQNSADFVDWVWKALRDYWGGPKLAESKLIQLKIVQQELIKHSGNPTRALQEILKRAIESLKPEGERSMTTTEWILYNILELRFLQGKKVRDVALQLAMSEPDFYRKQKIAIEEVARYISEMERLELANGTENHSALAHEV